MTLVNKNETLLRKRLVNAIDSNDGEKAQQILSQADLSVLFSHTQTHVLMDHPLVSLFGDELDNVNILQLCILKNNHDIALMLIEAVSKDATQKARCLNHRCANGNTAIHFAAAHNMHTVIVSLLKEGANPYLKNILRLRPVDCTRDERVIQALTDTSRQVRSNSTTAGFSSVLLQKAAQQQQQHHDRPHTPPDTSCNPQDYFDCPPKSTRPRSKDSSISIPTPPPSPTRTSIVSDTGKRKTRFTIQAVLIDGCDNGDVPSVQEALSLGAKINSRHGAYDRSPLMVALLNDQENVARLLLNSQDLNINYQDTNGWSALHYTAAMGLWSLLDDMAMKEGVDLYSVTDNNELIEDCPEDRVDRSKCKAIIQRARQVQKNNRKPRRVSGSIKP
ncbi:hypothetical protein Unana1_00939 [Umbelopsis nana]